MKSRRPYWIYFLEIDWEPSPPITTGYTYGYRVEFYVYITYTEGVMVILMISRCRGGHIGFIFLEIDKLPGTSNTSGYADGHRFRCMSLPQI